MDRISGLSDELLIKILLLLPTKDAVSTIILSKRWDSLWMWLPKLDFLSNYSADPVGESTLACFLNRYMPLHKAPAIETFRLDLKGGHCKPEDVRLWVVVALSRHLHELDIYYDCYKGKERKKCVLPSSLYACKSLVVLKLNGYFLFDIPRMVTLPCLKTLTLEKVSDLDGDTLGRLLSICPFLESLFVELYDVYDNIGEVIIVMPSLVSLSLSIPCECYREEIKIDAPCLKYLKLEDLNDDSELYLIENMPKLEEAFINVKYLDMTSIIRSITSVKSLTLCSEFLYGQEDFVFNQLESLKLCYCNRNSSKLLSQLLKDSPNLRILDLFQMDDHDDSRGMRLWNQPITVPACLASSLQTFSWSGYLGRLEDISVAVYILQNANRLKTARFVSDDTFTPKLEMIKALSRSSRASNTCELNFH